MICNPTRLRALGSTDAGPTDRHAIRMTEVQFDERAPASAETCSAVLVRHMLGAYFEVREGDAAPEEPQGLHEGHTLIEDLRVGPRLAMNRPFHAVQLLIPWAVLDRIAEQVGAAPLEALELPRGVGLADGTIAHLVSAMLPTLRAGQTCRQHYADQLGLALASHIAHVYGRLRPGERRLRGGLAPHILRRAQSILRADLRTPPSLGGLAEACGLSSRHFARAFRDSTGFTPHQWTMVARVAAAKALMQSGPDRLAEIALTCGFSDQSHLTRVFKREAGVSPAAWRRLNASETAAATARIGDTHRSSPAVTDRSDPAIVSRRLHPAHRSTRPVAHIAHSKEPSCPTPSLALAANRAAACSLPA